MKKRKQFFLFAVFLLILAVIIGLNSYFNVLHCNMRKDLQTQSDMQIHDVSAKIDSLEKEHVKDVTTVNRLRQQYLLLGTIYLEKKMWDMAIDALQKAMKYGESGAAVFYQMGLAYANKGYDFNNEEDFKTAESYYRKSIEKEPNYNDPAYGLAILLFYHLNGQQEAMNLLSDITERNPAFYPARFALARFSYELGNRENSLRIYENLYDDLSKLPKSGVINEYKNQCKQNISQITSELSGN